MRTSRILLLGSNGQLGRELALRFAGLPLVALDRSGADLNKPESLRALVREIRPQIMVNAAAYTAVDRAESEPDAADRVNREAPGILAEEAERLGAVLVHYSTDYVFDGSKAEPWVETDPTGPLNVYGATKLAGEQAVLAACSRALILRTSWVYAAHGHNFLRTMLRLAETHPVLRIVDDQWGAPTSAASLAEVTYSMLAMLEPQLDDAPSWAGVYHASCAGRTSWCRFARAIFSMATQAGGAALAGASTGPRVEAIDTADYPTPARRPRNSELGHETLWQRFGLRLPAWETALQDTLAQMERPSHV